MTPPRRLLHLPPGDVMRAASGLRLTDFETGATIQWEPIPAQAKCVAARWKHQNVFVAKPRRIYASTIFDLDDALFARLNDADGNRVRVGVALDTDDHTRERTLQMSSFLTQLNVQHERTEGRIVFQTNKRRDRSPRAWTASEIVVFTAGGRRAQAGSGLQRVRYSEAAYYKPGEIATISAAVGQVGQEIIETTLGSHAQNFIEIRNRWRDQKARNPYHQLRLTVEDHPLYRLPDEEIDDEEWEAMQARGFVIRGAAAYWLRVILPKFGGDVTRARGEYPQLESDMFEAIGGRYILRSPLVAGIYDVQTVPGMRGQTWEIVYHADPQLMAGRAIIAVDTSGRGHSRSAVLAIDENSAEILASVSGEDLAHDDLARCAAVMQHRLHVHRHLPRPTLLVEDNGIGNATCTELDTIGVPYARVNQDEESASDCMLAAKTAIEGLSVWEAPKELVEECDELVRVPKAAGGFTWKGRKDLLMCLGMALQYRQIDGYAKPLTPREQYERRERMDFAERMREDALERRIKPPWGVG
ncbi:MAG: hypothetical protein VW547_02030 [Alphaproteobacteria bacterium]